MQTVVATGNQAVINFDNCEASSLRKFTNVKVEPNAHLTLEMLQAANRLISHASSPPEEFTPYMNGLLSPNDEALLPCSPPAQPIVSQCTDQNDDVASKIKIVSFGQSRCTSS